MTRNTALVVPIGLALLLLSACKKEEALDEASVARGRDAIETCTACHSLSPGVNQVGPSLAGVIGRKAGTLDGYEYSDGMKGSGLTWTPEELVSFLTDPLAKVPDTKMALGEIETQEATDIVTFLRSND